MWYIVVLARLASCQKPGWRHGKWISGKDAPESERLLWPARPPMFGGAPLENKVPVVDRATQINTTGSWRVPAPLGDPLWASPRHNFKNNVIMGLALNYREESHRAFVGSARKAGYVGDVVVITEPLRKMQKSSAEYLKSMGVVAYAIEPDCSESKGGSIKHKTCKWRRGQPSLPLAIIRHSLYLSIASLYSEESNFYVADYRDTFFQRDPFAAVGRTLRGLDLILVAEHWPFKQIGNCPFNGGWVRNCWGKDAFESIRSQVVLCSGSYMGAKPAIVNLERLIMDEVHSNECHARGVPSDQGYVNYLYYTGRLPREGTYVQDRGSGVVNTLGSLDGSRPRRAGYLPESHVNVGQYWQLRDGEGYVLQDDKVTRSAAVHQYDRFTLEFRDFVRELGKCDAPQCYEYSPVA